jgi:hypothetical protein
MILEALFGRKHKGKFGNPKFVVYIEPNQRHGHGFQVRLTATAETVVDQNPYGMMEARAGAASVLEAASKTFGVEYDLDASIITRYEVE